MLRVYVGAAPGVGKTFAMLGEGHRRRERGTDVVVGLVETHGREKTAERIGDLEVVPRRVLSHRGADFGEMDVDAVLARAPAVALVDEYAHTNVPGSRNEKRWQDVEELLDAGIDVITTVNIQHLESLNDVVEGITGAKQRETIPDEIVRRADQIELVDMTPEALRRRMAHGNVYPAERVDAALGNYFREGNLGALRELALLWVADRVDEALQEYRDRHGIDRPWETRERVLVALTGAADGDRLVRRAARMAARARADLVAVHIRSQDGLDAGSDEGLGQQRALIEQLGGVYREFVGEDVGEALVSAARSLNATQIVLGATRRSRWSELVRGSVINRVIRETGEGIDVHVISVPTRGDGQSTLVVPRRRRPSALPARRQLLGLAVAAVLLVVLGVALTHLRETFGLPSVLLLFLLAVVIVAAIGGLWVALAAAVAAFLIVNWFFTPPLYTFTIADTEHLLALFVFLAVATIVSLFVSLASRRAADGQRARAEAQLLGSLAGISSTEVLLDRVRSAFGLRGVTLWHHRDGEWLAEMSAGEPAPLEGEQLEVDDDHLLTLAGDAIRADDRPLLAAFARELGSSLHVEELEADASTAESLAAANELRTAILSAVSHDLRTPLAGIKASVTSLLADDVVWPETERDEFLRAIDEDADRLDALVGNLLDMSRLQTGSLDVDTLPVGLEEIVPVALRSIGSTADGVLIDVPDDLPRVLADPGLLERAFANVVANAIRHGAGSPVRVTAGRAGDTIDLRVSDGGQGVPPGDRESIFRPFQRLGDAPEGDGVGLGLAVARGFVEAMGGSIELEDTPGGGLTVVLRLVEAVP